MSSSRASLAHVGNVISNLMDFHLAISPGRAEVLLIDIESLEKNYKPGAVVQIPVGSAASRVSPETKS